MDLIFKGQVYLLYFTMNFLLDKRLKVEVKKGDDDDDINSESGVPTLNNARYSPFS